MIYSWTEIINVPSKPGVYAWYYSPEITDFDLQDTINKILMFKSVNNMDEAQEIVKTFLNNYLFRFFQEEPYHATLRGSLKPKYEGTVEHTPELSEDLVARIVDEPERLTTVRQVLEKSTPNFSSPLYIGMSKNLNGRLKTHKKLIEKYCSQVNPNDFNIKDAEDRDKNFAMRVCSRNIYPTRLSVAINVLEDIGERYVDIENILNRIHYPLFGRN